jgi:hypothetical protein
MATPTKLNSYFSLNIKPVISDCIYDFSSILNKKNAIILNSQSSPDEMSECILKGIKAYDFISFKNECEIIFDSYYNIDEYNERLTNIISGL